MNVWPSDVSYVITHQHIQQQDFCWPFCLANKGSLQSLHRSNRNSRRGTPLLASSISSVSMSITLPASSSLTSIPGRRSTLCMKLGSAADQAELVRHMSLQHHMHMGKKMSSSLLPIPEL